MWLISGLLVLGLLIGNLVGMTAQSVVTALLGLLFAFVGGSLIALMGKLASSDRQLAGKCILSLSLGCLLGTYTGIFVSENQLLSNSDTPSSRHAIAEKKYLRSEVLDHAQAVQSRYAQGAISTEEAYKALLSILHDVRDAERR